MASSGIDEPFSTTFASQSLAGFGRCHVPIDRRSFEIILLTDDLIFLCTQDIIGDNEIEIASIHLQLIGTEDLIAVERREGGGGREDREDREEEGEEKGRGRGEEEGERGGADGSSLL
jgi:hypothetical protein